MKSPVVKRSIVLAGHKTSVSLEDAFWEGLKEIAKSDLVNSVDTDREHGNLSSALRLFVLNHRVQRELRNDRTDRRPELGDLSKVAAISRKEREPSSCRPCAKSATL
jgi:predicted DNA-binding ribbon-helix-helix protein